MACGFVPLVKVLTTDNKSPQAATRGLFAFTVHCPLSTVYCLLLTVLLGL